MNEVKLANELSNEFHQAVGQFGVPETTNSLLKWIAVASRARELLTQELIAARLLPEERAVIEAADAWAKRYICEPSSYGEPAASLLTAVRRLRESQTPKPRFIETEHGIEDHGERWYEPASRVYGLPPSHSRYHLCNLLNQLWESAKPQ